MPEIKLTETISTSYHDVTEEDKQLAREYNALVSECIAWSRKQMRWGTPQTKLVLARSAIASASRLAALDSKTQQEEHRLAFQALLTEVTHIDAATTPALPEPVIDQDEDT